MQGCVTVNSRNSARLAFQRLSGISKYSRSSTHSLSSTAPSLRAAKMCSLSENPTRAPWRDLLDSQLKQTHGYEFTIATIGYDSQKRPVPRVRTCGCRGFFPDLELHPKGQEAMDQQVEDGGNPSIYESDMLTFTTDARMGKLPQLDSSEHAVEAVFWLKDLMTQWRIKGTAYAIGDPQGEFASHERNSRQHITKRLRMKNNHEDVSKWTWEKAVTKYFANHSPVARGSFRNPPPGQPKDQPPANSDLRLGQKVTDLHDPVARGNFRVVLICPEEVERLDLTDQEDIKKWGWKLTDNVEDTGAQWNELEMWP